MEKKDMKSWIIVGLSMAIIVVLLTQPIIVTQVSSLAWVTDDGKYEIQGKYKINEYFEGIEEFLEENIPYLPEKFIKHQRNAVSEGDYIVWEQELANSTRLLMFGNVITGDFDFVNYTTFGEAWNEGVTQTTPSINEGVVTWFEYGYNETNVLYVAIKYANIIEGGGATEIVPETDASFDLISMPIISEDKIVYMSNYKNRLWVHDIATTNNTLITNYSDDGARNIFTHTFWGDMVFWNVYHMTSDTYKGYAYDIGKNETNPFTALDVAVYYLDYHENYLVYRIFEESEFRARFYDLENERGYTLNPGWVACAETATYGGIIFALSTTEWSGDYRNIAVIDIQDVVLFHEDFTLFTNDTGIKIQIDASEYICTWMEQITVGWSIISEEIWFTLYQEYEEISIPITPEIETADVYNLNVIYALIILGSLLGIAVCLWFLELPEVEKIW